MSKITLTGIFGGNPFADHPQLRDVWPVPRSGHVEADTVADLAMGVLADPCRNRVYLVVDGEGHVVGITGFFQPTADPMTLGLRWHGMVPSARGRGYSEAAIKQLCVHAAYFHPEAVELVEYVPFADEKNGRFLVAHFERCGFVADGPARDASLFPATLSLPAGSGNWVAMRRSLSRERGLQSGVVSQEDRDAAIGEMTAAVHNIPV